MSQSISFALTINPRGDFTEEQLDQINDTIQDRSQFWHVVTGLEGERRHLHAGYILSDPTTPSREGQRWKRFIARHFGEAQFRVKRWFRGRLGARSWMDYLQDQESGAVLSSNIEKDHDIREYLTEDIPIVERKERAVDHELNKLQEFWNESKEVDVPPEDYEECRRFLTRLQYKDKKIPCYKRGPGYENMMAVHLFHYITSTERDVTMQVALDTLQPRDYI